MRFQFWLLLALSFFSETAPKSPLPSQKGGPLWNPAAKREVFPFFPAKESGVPVDEENFMYSSDNDPTASPVIFQPDSLDFGDSPLCIPTVQNIVLFARSNRAELTIDSVSTDAWQHFHPVIEKDPSSSNVQISVLFLPREIGSVEGKLFITTTLGNFIYIISGRGIDNVYRVRPILGYKLPVDKNYYKPILVHNPYDELLKMKEIYTSEGFLLLSLPEVPQETVRGGQVKLWEIPPHHTKSVIYLNFRATHPGKYQGFVHVKTNKDALIVHIEFVVTKSGLHCLTDELDFGTIISDSDPQTCNITLQNSGPFPVTIREIHPVVADSSVSVNIKQSTIVEGSVATVATISYSGYKQGSYGGKILLVTNDSSPHSQRLEIPYKARVLHGAVEFFRGNTSFYAGAAVKSVAQQTLVLFNAFQVPLLFRGASVADGNFEIVGFVPGTVLHPGTVGTILQLRFTSNDTELYYVSWLVLETNVTRLTVPLIVYHGRLSFTLPEPRQSYSVGTMPNDSPLLPAVWGHEFTDSSRPPSRLLSALPSAAMLAAARRARLPTTMDFGILGLGEFKALNFSLTNVNPVPITLLNWRTNLTSLKIRYVSVDEDVSGNEKMILHTGQSQVFVAELTTQEEEQERWGFIEFDTDHKTLHIDVHFVSLLGSLRLVKELILEPTFPGHVVKVPLVITNTFNRVVTLSSIVSSDPRILPVLTVETLPPGKEVQAGFVLFDPGKAVDEQGKPLYNFMASALAKSKEKNQTHGKDAKAHPRPSSILPFGMTSESLKSTLALYKARFEEFEQLKRASGLRFNAQLTLTTSMDQKYTLSVHASLAQPRVATMSLLNYSLTAVDTKVSQYVSVKNPSDGPIEVQLISLNELGDARSLLTRVHRADRTALDDVDMALDKDQPFSIAANGQRSLVLLPGQTGQLGPIVFSPLHTVSSHAIYLVKNNLTLMEVVDVMGEGGKGKLLFRHNLTDVDKLELHVRRPQLKAFLARKKSESFDLPALWNFIRGAKSFDTDAPTFSKQFHVINTGNFDVEILHWRIYGFRCSAYGLSITPCEKTVLHPRERISFTLSFTPDFSTSSVNPILHLQTAMQGTIKIPILVTLPHGLLPHLYENVPSLITEIALRMIAVGVMWCIGLWLLRCLYVDYYLVKVSRLLKISEGKAPKLSESVERTESDLSGNSEDGALSDSNSRSDMKVVRHNSSESGTSTSFDNVVSPVVAGKGSSPAAAVSPAAISDSPSKAKAAATVRFKDREKEAEAADSDRARTRREEKAHKETDEGPSAQHVEKKKKPEKEAKASTQPSTTDDGHRGRSPPRTEGRVPATKKEGEPKKVKVRKDGSPELEKMSSKESMEKEQQASKPVKEKKVVVDEENRKPKLEREGLEVSKKVPDAETEIVKPKEQEKLPSPTTPPVDEVESRMEKVKSPVEPRQTKEQLKEKEKEAAAERERVQLEAKEREAAIAAARQKALEQSESELREKKLSELRRAFEDLRAQERQERTKREKEQTERELRERRAKEAEEEDRQRRLREEEERKQKELLLEQERKEKERLEREQKEKERREKEQRELESKLEREKAKEKREKEQLEREKEREQKEKEARLRAAEQRQKEQREKEARLKEQKEREKRESAERAQKEALERQAKLARDKEKQEKQEKEQRDKPQQRWDPGAAPFVRPENVPYRAPNAGAERHRVEALGEHVKNPMDFPVEASPPRFQASAGPPTPAEAQSGSGFNTPQAPFKKSYRPGLYGTQSGVPAQGTGHSPSHPSPSPHTSFSQPQLPAQGSGTYSQQPPTPQTPPSNFRPTGSGAVSSLVAPNSPLGLDERAPAPPRQPQQFSLFAPSKTDPSASDLFFRGLSAGLEEVAKPGEQEMEGSSETPFGDFSIFGSAGSAQNPFNFPTFSNLQQSQPETGDSYLFSFTPFQAPQTERIADAADLLRNIAGFRPGATTTTTATTSSSASATGTSANANQ